MNERFVDPLLWCYDTLKILTIFTAAILTAQAATAQTTQENIDALEQSLLRSLEIVNGELPGQFVGYEVMVNALGQSQVSQRFFDLRNDFVRLVDLMEPGELSDRDLELYYDISSDLYPAWDGFSGFLEFDYFPIAQELERSNELLGQELTRVNSLLDEVSGTPIETANLEDAVEKLNSAYSHVSDALDYASLDLFPLGMAQMSVTIEAFRRGVHEDIDDAVLSGGPVILRNHFFDVATEFFSVATILNPAGLEALAVGNIPGVLDESLNDAIIALRQQSDTDAPFGASVFALSLIMAIGVLRVRGV